MHSSSCLFWALGTNGEGSSRVTFAFVQHVCQTYQSSSNKTIIVYSAESTLDQLIHSFLKHSAPISLNPLVRLVKLPKFSRNYFIHFAIKFFAGPFLRFNSIIVFDDFPFWRSPRQVLYFHQPNLIYNNILLWRIKRTAFRLLLSSSLIVYVQTIHMRDSFVARFGLFRTICFLHDVI